ncbi:MAG: ATP-binding cassette domain-containing protein [Thermodesulfovibrionales bacterium]|nr:ATP-binding cassette domain-containing protein [Thermodesulfovibrionales bacterium]
MIKLECASLKGFLECASFSVSDGNICAVLAETDFEKNLLLRVLTGLTGLDSGKVFIFGREISSITYAELGEVRKKMGVVLNRGGLVSNLKVWENLMLPLAYHASLSYKDMEEKMMDVLNNLGYNDDLNMLPGPLPTYKKKLLGLARAILMEPDLIIYDSVFDGLSSDIRNRVLEAVNAFHEEKKGRVSLFLASSEGSIKGIMAERVYVLKKGNFHERN